MELVSLSENNLLVLFEQKVNQNVFHQVTACFREIEAQLSDYIIDINPAYASIHIFFNITKISHGEFRQLLSTLLNRSLATVQNSNKKKINVISIPVYYGEEVALDMQQLARFANMSVDEVIRIHSAPVYHVYAIGFAPGFAYLGDVDEPIAIGRKATPRKKIAKGSVGIADTQTAVYPSDSPGGWQIIGKTPVAMIDYNSDCLTRFEAGDRVRFLSIGREEYLDLGGSL